MAIEWVDIKEKGNALVESWLSDADKRNLCMTEKGWGQTAADIEDCLKHMKGSAFKNLMVFRDGEPVCAMMFGIESGGVLNLYNITVNPEFRGQGMTAGVISFLLRNIGTLSFGKPYEKVKVSTIPENKGMQRILDKLGFANLGFNGDYVVFENSRNKELTQNF